VLIAAVRRIALAEIAAIGKAVTADTVAAMLRKPVAVPAPRPQLAARAAN